MFDIIGRLKALFSGRNNGPKDALMSLDKRLVFQVSGKRVPKFSQLSHLPRLLSSSERRSARMFIALLAVSVCAMGAKFLNDRLIQVPANGGEYIEASVGNPRFVNPLLATADADLDLAKLVFSGLMRTDAAGKVVPDLAESYEISEDGKVYTFHLHSNIEWHDGHTFSSRDVVATVGFAKDAGWKSPLASQFKNVSVEMTDDRTVKFTLSEPFAPFLSTMTFGILPEHLWSEILPENAARAELNVKPIGTGPFKFKSFTKDKRGAIHTYVLSRHAKHHGGAAHLDSFAFRFYEDFASAHDALLKRKVDGLSFLPLEYHDTADKLRAVKAYAMRLPQYTAIFINEKKNATLRTKEVRQALALATDREAVRAATGRTDGTIVNGPILAGFIGFHPEVKKYAHDQGAAAELLEKAGWKMGEDAVRSKKSIDDKKKEVLSPLTVTITTVDAKEYVAAAEAVKKSWEAVGVKVALELVPASRIQKDKIRTRDYDVLIYGEILAADPDPFPFWHSSQSEGAGLNLSQFSNRRADELLEKARTSLTQEAREPMYREFQDILADDVPAIFLYSPTYAYPVSRTVKGLEEGAIFTPSDRFTDAARWYVRTSRRWR